MHVSLLDHEIDPGRHLETEAGRGSLQWTDAKDGGDGGVEPMVNGWEYVL